MSQESFRPAEWDAVSMVNIAIVLDTNYDTKSRYEAAIEVMDSAYAHQNLLQLDSVFNILPSQNNTDSILIRGVYKFYAYFINKYEGEQRALKYYQIAHKYGGDLNAVNDVLNVENPLGNIYNKYGDHELSQYYYLLVINRLRKLRDEATDKKLKNNYDNAYYRARNNYGWLLHWLGDERKAVDILTSSNKTSKQKNFNIPLFYSSLFLAEIYLKNNQVEISEKYARLIPKSFSPEVFDLNPLANIDHWMILGEIEEQKNNTNKATAYFKLAIDSLTAARNRGNRTVAKAYLRIAKFYFRNENDIIGEQLLKAGLKQLHLKPRLYPDMSNDIYEENTIAEILEQYAQHYSNLFKKTNEIVYADSAFMAVDGARATYNLLRQGFISTSDGLQLITSERKLTDIAIELLWQIKTSGFYSDAYAELTNNYFAKSKNNALLDARVRQNTVNRLNSDERSNISSIKMQISELLALHHATQDVATNDSIFYRIVNLRKTLKQYLKTQQEVKTEKLLDNAIDFLVTDNNVYCRHIKNKIIQFDLVMPRWQLDSLLYKSHTGIINKDTSISFYRNQFILFEKVIQPYMTSSSDLFIYPDGPLQLCSFAALVQDTIDIRYLIEDYDIGITYNYADTIKKIEYKNLNITAILPQYKKPSFLNAGIRSGIYHLPYAEQEIDAIKSTWNARVDLITEDVKSGLICGLNNSGIVHYAGHALVINDSGLLVFDSDTNSNMSELEILELPASSRLVVLSACQTGLGKWVPGEGIQSLARSFLQSGAQSLVYTLWSINDQTSSHIVSDFYQELKDMSSPVRAMSMAQRSYLSNASNKLSHPYYWAAFQVTGGQEQLNSSCQGSQLILLLALIGVIFLLIKFIKK